jgi:hypothetical protein
LPKAASFDAAFVFSGTRISTELAGKRLLIETDDESLLPALFIAFGAGDGRDASPPFFRAMFEHRVLRVVVDGNSVPPRDLLFGINDAYSPYVLNDATVSFLDDGSEQFTIDGDALRVHVTPRWRAAVTALLTRAFAHFISDVILFHASAIGITSRAILFVATREGGKSTLSLALACRGHEFLSDEYACYDPATHDVLPYRRPVGIREGPRAAAVDRALARGEYRGVQQDDSLRVDLETLIPLSSPRRLPLHAIVFLDGFAPRPQLRAAENQVEMLKTLYSSLVTPAHGKRAFDILRMLSRARTAFLKIGDPDETALLLEEEFGS